MRLLGFFAVLLAHAPSAYAARAQVASATTSHAYANVGRNDGVAMDDVLQMDITSKVSLPCTVEQVSEHHMSCRGASIPVGAFFTILHAAPRPTVRLNEGPDAPMSQGQVHRIQMRLAATPPPRVEHEAPLKALRTRGRASLKHEAWFWLGIQPRGIQDERLDLALYTAPITRFPDLSFQARLSLLVFTEGQRPWPSAAQTLRNRPNDQTQLYVWQTELSERGHDDHFVFAVGRILPWYLPGIAVLDGAQAGYRSSDGSFEVGGYAGVEPNLQTLILAFDHGEVGAYVMQQRAFGTNWTQRNVGRVGFNLLIQGQSAVEIETRHELAHGTDFQIGVTPRFGIFVDRGGTDLEALRGDISANWHDKLRFYVGARYANQEVDLAQGLYGPAANLRSTFFSDGILDYAPLKVLSVGANASFARDDQLPFNHWAVGPQLGLPRLFGGHGGVTASYLFEGGTYPGNSAWLQALVQPGERARLWLRGSYITDTFQTVSVIHELSYYARAEVDLVSWLHMGAFVRVNQGLGNANVPSPTPDSIMGSLQLTGTL